MYSFDRNRGKEYLHWGLNPLTTDRMVMKIGGGTAIGAILIIPGTSTVEAFWMGGSIVSTDSTLLAGVETVVLFCVTHR